MTSPVGVGYPDWGRQASEAQVLEINDINVTNPSGFAYPIRYVGNAKSLQLWANATTSGMRIQLQFWGDPQGVIIMDSYVVNLLVQDVVKQPIPILGPYMGAVIQFSPVGTQRYTLQLWRTPELARFAGLEGDVNLWVVDNAPINAGQTILSDSQYVMEGPATWSVSVGAAVFTARLLSVDYTGTVTLLDTVNGAGPFETPRPVWLPPHHIRCSVRNDNAANQLYTLTGTRRHNI